MSHEVDGDALTLTSASLQAECELLEASLRTEGGDVAALSGYAPGGADNPEAGARGWYRYFRQLDRAHAAQTSGTAVSRAGDATEELLIDAMAERPLDVACEDGIVRSVHPKSFYALRWLDALDFAVLRIRELADDFAGDRTLEGDQVAVLGQLLDTKAVQLWLWILATPGGDLPFLESDNDPTPPEWTRKATAVDILRFQGAHVQVNHRDLQIIATAFPRDPKEPTRLRLAGFLGAYAEEKGLHTQDVFRRWSLRAVFAKSVVAAQAAREARANAKEKAQRESV